MERVNKLLNKALFQVRWLAWTPERRYVYLWNRTCSK